VSKQEKGLAGIGSWFVGLLKRFKEKHPTVAEFLVFFMLSNGVTVLQMILMPVLKGWFDQTALIDTSFQIIPIGSNLDGSQYFVFNYPAGTIASGGGGGLAYFLAVQIVLAIAQVINFFAQRNITFKSNGNIWRSAFWYLVAYIFISIGAAALQGVYKAPFYNLTMNTLGWGHAGETVADVVTMIINSAISFWVFFPIFKVIFKNDDAPKS
jgi:putative flippase GtrA